MTDALSHLRPTTLVPLLLSLLLLLGGCADEPEDQPGQDAGEAGAVAGNGALVQSELADVPVPEGAREVGTSEEQGVQTRNFVVTATSPSSLQSFYRENLTEQGWELVDEDDLGPDLRTTWQRDENTLLVAAAPEGTTDDSSLSLQLSAEGDVFPDGG